MRCWRGCVTQVSLPAVELWRGRFGTVTAIGALCVARLTVAWLPLWWWRGSLGAAPVGNAEEQARARKIARQVDRAAARLPFLTKCLPRAMGLSWLLRRQAIGHSVVIAVRPLEWRSSADSLHAWVEIDGAKVMGDLPGPWLETLRFEGRK